MAGSLAKFAAIRRASSLVSRLLTGGADRLPGRVADDERSSACSSIDHGGGITYPLRRWSPTRSTPASPLVAPNSGHDQFSSSGSLAKVAAALRSLVNL